MSGSIEFSHLHVHTEHSRVDGLSKTSTLVQHAKTLGFNSLAITDHGTMSGAITFHSECVNAGIKPIFGMEGYILNDGTIGHITLLANGRTGFNNLIELNNIGHRSGESRPAFRIEDLIKYNEGLVVLTGCIASPFNSMHYEDARDLAVRLLSVMNGRVFAEIMLIADRPLFSRAAQLSEDLKIPPILTNDVHFPKEEMADIHATLTQIKSGFSYNSRKLYLATAEDLLSRAKFFGKDAEQLAIRGIKNAYLMSQRLESIDFNSTISLPEIKRANHTLWKMCVDALKNKAKSAMHLADMKERLKYEFGIVQSMGFSTYFLILQDIVSWAKRNGIRVGPGRGSGAGSLILYLIGITEIDPIQYGLSFERFLNPKRVGMPDVDVDFESHGRGRVIDYAKSKWDAHPVATYSRYMHKNLIHELARFYHLPRDIEVEAADSGVQSEAFVDLCAREEKFKLAYDTMLGQVSHMGQHAGGVIITSAKVPLEKPKGIDSVPIAAWTEGHTQQLTTAGVVKYDLLGLTTLDLLKRLETKFGMRAPDLKPGDEVFSVFRNGDTAGIFQFTGSSGIVEYTKKVNPQRFEDLVAINALFRPGTLDAGTAQKYPEWRKSPRKIHPLVDDILKDTYGVIVYQEQVSSIFSAMTDGDLASADMARKTISKIKGDRAEWEVHLLELKTKFFEGAKAKSVSDKIANMLWEEIVTHTRYSFNKSHSVAYAKLAADCAWWKYHHTADFYASLLSVDSMNAQRYIISALMSGIEFYMPDINVSDDTRFLVNGDKILLPLSIIKYLGENGAAHIIETRKAGAFTSIEDFMLRCKKKFVRSNARIGLSEIGAFAKLEGSTESLQIKQKEKLTEYQTQIKYLGFIIPSEKTMEAIREHERKGFVAGIIESKKEKESNYGPYTSYYLVPGGTFWIRGLHKPEVGSIVSVKLKKNSTKCLAWSLI